MINYNFLRLIAEMLGFVSDVEDGACSTLLNLDTVPVHTYGSDIYDENKNPFYEPLTGEEETGILKILYSNAGSTSLLPLFVDDKYLLPIYEDPETDPPNLKIGMSVYNADYLPVQDVVLNDEVGIDLGKAYWQYKRNFTNADPDNEFIFDQMGLFCFNEGRKSIMLCEKAYYPAITLGKNTIGELNSVDMDFTFTATSGLVKNFFSMMRGILGLDSAKFRRMDSLGTEDSYTIIDNPEYHEFANIMAPESETAYGIIVGSGADDYNGDNHKIHSQLTTLDHSASSGKSCSYTPAGIASSLVIERSFTNNTSGILTVTEMGLAIQGVDKPYLIFYITSDPIIMLPGAILDIEMTLATEDDRFTMEVSTTCTGGVNTGGTDSNQVYAYKSNNDYLYKLANENNYTYTDRVETGVDGKRLFLIDGVVYAETSSKETGRILTGDINGRKKLGRLKSGDAMQITPILKGDKITGGEVRGTAATLIPYIKNAIPGVKADLYQLEIVPDEDFNYLETEEIEVKK